MSFLKLKCMHAFEQVGKLKNLCLSFFKLKSVKPILFLKEEVREIEQSPQFPFSSFEFNIPFTVTDLPVQVFARACDLTIFNYS